MSQLNQDLFDMKDFRDTWDDTDPIPDRRDPDMPLSIAHSNKYDLIMGIFRAALDKKEHSRRALKLTEVVIGKNPSNITAWWYREQILEKIGYKWEEEIRFLDELQFHQPKPYQMWNHRMWLDNRCETTPDERQSLFRLISIDQKNFHAFHFFSWFMKRWNVYDYFLKFTDDILSLDPTNNSAFNFRYNIVKTFNLPIDQEITFALSMLAKNTSNESATTFIRGLIKMEPSLASEVKSKITELVQSQPSKQTLSLLYSIAEMEGDNTRKHELCDELSSIDPLKNNYWQALKSENPKFL